MTDDKEIVTAYFGEDGEELTVLAETKAAIGLGEPGEEVAIWIPKSQIHSPEPEKGDSIDSIDIPRWLAEAKDLIV